MTITVEVNAEAVLSSDYEHDWLDKIFERNRLTFQKALLQWAKETSEGQRLMELRLEYRGCRLIILGMLKRKRSGLGVGDILKTSTFSKKDAKAAMKRLQEIRAEVGGEFTSDHDTLLDNDYHWILQQEE